jgi:hypothetical protein
VRSTRLGAQQQQQQWRLLRLPAHKAERYLGPWCGLLYVCVRVRRLVVAVPDARPHPVPCVALTCLCQQVHLCALHVQLQALVPLLSHRQRVLGLVHADQQGLPPLLSLLGCIRQAHTKHCK